MFTSLEENREYQEKITFGDNSKSKVKSIGKIAISNDHSLSNVLYVANTHPTKAYMSTSRVLELLHMDLFGPTTYKSLGGNLYCLVIVDDYSRYTWTFFLHDKSEVATCFKKFAKRAQNKFKVKIKKIRSDNGKEFDNTNIEAYCDEIGIKHEVSSTYTPQQNGVVERKNWTFITLARTMLDEYNTLEKLWAEAINTA
jgi:transposase InsO family protein